MGVWAQIKSGRLAAFDLSDYLLERCRKRDLEIKSFVLGIMDRNEEPADEYAEDYGAQQVFYRKG